MSENKNSTPSRTVVTDAPTVYTVNHLRDSINALSDAVDAMEPKISGIAAVLGADSPLLNSVKASLLSEIRATAKALHDFAMANLASVDSTDLGDIIKLRYDETTRRTRKVTPKPEKTV